MVNRRERNRDSKDYDDWVDAALQDYLAAELLMSDSRLYDSCAFHCQQCVEKALKAYLLFQNGYLVDGHNLTWLCKQAIKLDKKFIEWLDESAALNHYYIETRYPSDFTIDITQKRINTVFKMAKDMINFIDDEIKTAQTGQ